MNASGIIFLLGLFAAPAVLLWLGHRLRGRGAAAFGAFWGGVVGHTLALVAMLITAHWPPVLWVEGSVREGIIFVSLLTASILGAAIGAAVAVARAK